MRSDKNNLHPILTGMLPYYVGTLGVFFESGITQDLALLPDRLSARRWVCVWLLRRYFSFSEPRWPCLIASGLFDLGAGHALHLPVSIFQSRSCFPAADVHWAFSRTCPGRGRFLVRHSFLADATLDLLCRSDSFFSGLYFGRSGILAGGQYLS